VTLPLPPPIPGAYRWFYADVQTERLTAVGIFMIGAVFSARYAVGAARGASPLEHCAVNFALYDRGRRRCWVFSEYGGVVRDGEETLWIGRSCLARGADGRVELVVDDRTAPWGRPVRARLGLTPACAPVAPVALDDGGHHWWQPLACRATARLVLPDEGIDVAGLGYHDTNWGDEPLGGRLPGWRWGRVHGAERTGVALVPPAPRPAIHLVASARGVAAVPPAAAPDAGARSGWALRLPARIAAGGIDVPAEALLESAPFYARQEGRRDGLMALGEVADFHRFRSPWIRWMARFRTRVEAGPR
jgi:carotenoid 1,2-hydratase